MTPIEVYAIADKPFRAERLAKLKRLRDERECQSAFIEHELATRTWTPEDHRRRNERQSGRRLIGLAQKLHGLHPHALPAMVPVSAPEKPDCLRHPPKVRSRQNGDAGPADPMLRASTVSPPLANRGGAFTEGDADGLFPGLDVRLHWLTCSFPAEKKEEVRLRVSRMLREDAQDRLWGGKGYANSCVWKEDNSLLYWTPGVGHACLDLVGDTLDRMIEVDKLELIKWLYSIKAHFTRLDPAVDVPRSMVTMDDVRDAAAKGNYAYVKTDKPIREKLRDGTITSDTVYFGSKAGGMQLCIYDKQYDPIHPKDCIRFESRQYKTSGKSQLLAERIVKSESVDEMLCAFASTVGGCIDFLDRAADDPNLDRLPRLSWWASLTALLGNVRESVPRLVPPLASAVAALKRQWGSTLTLLRIALQSMPTPANIGAVVENWCDHFEEKINWQKQQGRDLGVSLSMLLEGPYRAALAAQEV